MQKQSKQDICRMGGISNWMKHGTAHMHEIGKLGGRPRKDRLQAAPAAKDGKGEIASPVSLNDLQALFRQKYQKGNSR